MVGDLGPQRAPKRVRRQRLGVIRCIDRAERGGRYPRDADLVFVVDDRRRRRRWRRRDERHRHPFRERTGAPAFRDPHGDVRANRRRLGRSDERPRAINRRWLRSAGGDLDRIERRGSQRLANAGGRTLVEACAFRRLDLVARLVGVDGQIGIARRFHGHAADFRRELQ